MARHIPHLYLAGPWQENRIDVTLEVRRHLEKVLRINAPAEVTYTDGAGLTGSGSFDGASVGRGFEEMQQHRSGLTVAVAPPKNTARLRFVVEKLAEIGVNRLVWLTTEYAEGRPPRLDKAAAWAIAALEQSRGAWLMDIDGPVSISEVAQFGSPLFADQGGGPVGDFDLIPEPVLCVGPEGGFAPGELSEHGPRVNLGPTVLRVETAAVVGATMFLRRSPG